MNRVPHGTSAEDREATEQILAEFARSGSPDDLGKVGDRILAHLDPDGRLTTDTDRARMRGITIGRQRPDGMSPIRGDIDPVLRACGVPVATILTVAVDDIEKAAGVATTATGGTVPLRDALILAERSLPWLAVFDHAGISLHLGRRKRLASPAQRLALIAALKGCSRPGCDAPASLCAVHHVLDYRKNGTTDITNLTLACDSCHALIHDGPGGWRTSTEGPRSPYPGRTAWIAPPHIDPEQRPRINHRHRAGELLAEALSRIHIHDERRGEQHRHERQVHVPPRPPPEAERVRGRAASLRRRGHPSG